MALLSPRISAQVQALIDAYDLHRTVPVDIRQWAEAEGWDVRVSSRLDVLRGFAVVYESLHIMAINANMPLCWQRAAIAHEAAHLTAEHADSFHTMHRTPLWNAKQELEADTIAAELLIPDWVLMECETFNDVAAACDVPVELAQRRIGTL